MQFDDPKSVLEAAAAKPSRPIDAAALVRRGTRMRRARLAAAAAGLAVVVAGASASFGLLGTEREGPRPADGGLACGDLLRASIFLRDDASRRDVAALKAELRADPGVVELRHLTKSEAYEEFRKLYSDQPEFSETVPSDALPASLRIEAADEAALERIAGLESRVIYEIVHNLGDFRRLCGGLEQEPDEQEVAVTEPPASDAADPPSAAVPVPPPVLGPAMGEHVNDVLITMDEAACDATPSWEGAPPAEPGKRWCHFKVSIRNLSRETFHFETRYQLLQTTAPTHIYRPWQPETISLAAADDVFDGSVAPGERGGGWLVYRLREREEPDSLTLTAPGYGAAGGRAGAFGCREAFAVDAACSYSSDRALLRFRYMQSVELYHCGVEPFFFAGRRWVSDPPPFDATNAPADFTGTGTIELVSEKGAIYTDSSGAEIELRAGDEWEPPPCA